MALNYSIDAEDSVLVLRLSGVPDRASKTQLFRDVATAARQHDCYDILGLSSTEMPGTLENTLEIKDMLKAAGVTSDFRVAWVNPNAAAEVMIKLVEEMLKNSDLANMKAFQDEQSARMWLSRKT